MKKLIFLLTLFLALQSFGQELSLQIVSKNKEDKNVLDSVGYQKKHQNVKAILDEVDKLSNNLLKIGYLENNLITSQKINDTLYQFDFNLGKQTKLIYIFERNKTDYLSFEKDTIVLPINQTEAFLNTTLSELETKGFSLASLKLIDFKKVKDQLYASLKIDLNTKRTLDEIVLNGYEKFPEGHKRNLQRLYRRKTFNKDNLQNIYRDFNNYRFVNQTKYPEILFTNDSTKVFVYLEKAKSNKFDGYIGFANNESGTINFTGYLDVQLRNILNSGEDLSIYWRSDDNKQVTFNANIELPYIFNSPLGVKANLNIFRQDSTFQNTKTAIDLGYFFSNNKKLFIGYQSTESSDIQNQNNISLADYNSNFVTSTFQLTNFINDSFFPEKTNITVKMGAGKRVSSLREDDQLFFEINLNHNFCINTKNSISIKSQNYYLQSDTYITNELYRFGGIQSIRGFNENSLQGNIFTSILSEYRYLIAPSLYVHSVIDYGFYRDEINSTKNSLIGIGFGLGVQTKNGILNLVYANGVTDQQSLTFQNSILQLKLTTSF